MTRSFAFLFLLGSVLLGCDSLTGSTDTVAVEFINETGANIHIVASGETFDISNRLLPAQARRTTFPVPQSDLDAGRLDARFRAGSNGMTTDELTCQGDISLGGGDPLRKVVYTVAGLVCRDW